MDKIKFRGYKLSFELHAAHGNITDSNTDYHFHTFSIVLWLKKLDMDMESFDDMEKQVKTFLAPFENEYLGDHALFQGSDLTVESLGDIFYCEFEKILNDHRFLLLRLDIWDNPVRQYSITKYRMDMTIHPLNISMLLGTSHIKEAQADKIIEAKLHPVPKVMESKTQNNIDSNEEMVEESEAVVQQDEVIQTSKSVKKRYHLRTQWKVLLACLLFGFVAGIFYICIQGGMISLYGNDTLCHLYRSDYIVSQILQGNYFPLYDPSWYNGVEVMRYWGPLPLYLLAILQMIFQTTSLSAYMILLTLLMFGSAIGWLRFGIKYKRVGVSIVIGLLWFFLPENTRLFVSDGNIPRVVINVLFPYLLYAVWMFLHEKKDRSAISIVCIMSLCVFCHLGSGAMLLVSVLLFTLFYAHTHKAWRRWRRLFPCLVLPFVMAGIWSVPAMIGGAVGGSSTNQVMATYFAPLLESLTPTQHWDGVLESFYIGLSIFVISLLGIFIGKKKQRPLFLAGCVLILCTSLTAFEILSRFPFSQFLWMIRFIPFAIGIILMGFVLWDGLRKWVTIVFCVLLFLDCGSSIQYLYRNFWGQGEEAVIAHSERLASQEALEVGKQYTTQRLSLMDLSGYGAFAPYYISGVDKKVSAVFGAGWEGAGTSSNIVGINTALEFGHYDYLFDRNLELGADTIIIPISFMARGKYDEEEVTIAGKNVGYELVYQDDKSLVFHYPNRGTFGTKTIYENLAIGESAEDIAMLYPNFEIGNSIVLEDYTVEDFLPYKRVYLSKFTYRDKAQAEALLRSVSEAGIDVFIDMNFIPVDSKSRKQELFEVSAQSYRFSERFPNLQFQGEVYQPSLFAADDATWNAVTLSGLDEVLGTSTINNKSISFYGTKENENLHFLGFNLAYHAVLTKDKAASAILKQMMQIEDTLPKRELVPISIAYDSDQIRIDSMEDDVNTGIASLDILHNEDMREKNHLLYVDKGTTILKIKYPHLAIGLSVSVVGITLSILYVIWLYRKARLEETL